MHVLDTDGAEGVRRIVTGDIDDVHEAEVDLVDLAMLAHVDAP